MAVRPAITLHMVQPLQWNIQRVAGGKFQDQIVTVEALNRKTFEATILGDAVLNMDDIVAYAEIFQGRKEGGSFTLRLRLVTSTFGKQLLFRQNSQTQVRCEESSR